MKLIGYLLIAISSLSAQEYTLDMLLEAAYRNSDAMQVAHLQMKNSELKLSETKRMMLPSASVNSQFNHGIGAYGTLSTTDGYEFQTPVPSTSTTYSGDTIITRMLDGLAAGVIPQRNSLSLGIDLKQTIWAQNKIRHTLEALRIANRSHVCKWQDAQMQVKANITKLFYNALLAQQKIKIESEAAQRYIKTHELIKDYFTAGLRSELDTLNSYIDYVSGELKVSEAVRSFREARQFLITYSNIEENPDSMKLAGELLPEEYEKDFATIQENMLKENKELTVIKANYDQAEIYVKISKDDYFPTVYGGLSLSRYTSYNDVDNFDFVPDRKLYLGLNYDIFSGGQRSSRVKQSKNDARILWHQYEETRKRLLVEITSLYDRLQENRMRMDESKRLLNAAEKGYDIAFDNYKAGVLKQIELDNSNDRLLRAQLFLSQTIFNYNLVVIELRIKAADYLYK